MGSRCLWLSLSCYLLAASGGSPVGCNRNLHGQPPNFTQIDGLWNLIGFSALSEQELLLEIVKQVKLAITKVSINERELNITSFYRPGLTNFEHKFTYDRIPAPGDALSYAFRSDVISITLTVVQKQPESLILIQKGNNTIQTVMLYSKQISLPESEVQEFKEWSRCTNLTFYKELKYDINYAQECFGLWKLMNWTINIEEDEDWVLIAKASTELDRNYLIRIYYTARVKFSKDGEEYSIREIQMAPMDKTLMNVTWRAGGILLDEGGDRVTLTRFHSEEDTFILGIDKVNGKRGTLYLMSRTPRVSQAVVEGFKRQAVCYAADHVYVVPGRREKDPRNDGEKENPLD
ncbi:uncharacterized protein LOC142484946 [Ascaphus truei]|uniref:uncharacterized protein LOC142484946 n=1 Tax=Ascaphus truei TaxID=8439 RepID=UPI003F5A151E